MLEADVWLYRGRIEVRHEKTVRGLPLLWDRWKLEPGLAPRLTLEALLAALGDGRAGLLLDLKGKDPRLPDAIVGALRSSGASRPVAVCSQDWPLLERFRAHPEISVLHSIGKRRRLRAFLDGRTPAGGHGISINRKFLDAATLRRLRAMTPLLVTWAVADPYAAVRLAEAGVDGMITDDLAVVRDIARRRAAGV